MSKSTWLGLRAMAWMNVLLHVIALVLADVGIRPGSPLVSLEERMSYLAGTHVLWTVAWSVWMLCPIALIAFLGLLVHQMGDRTGFASLGLMITVVGAAFDLLCDSIYLIALPELAAKREIDATAFSIVERITGIASLVIANGAYSVAVVLFTVALRRQQERLSRVTIITGYAVGFIGLVLSAAGFTGMPRHAEWATPPTIGLFCVWVVLVARALKSSEQTP